MKTEYKVIVVEIKHESSYKCTTQEIYENVAQAKVRTIKNMLKE